MSDLLLPLPVAGPHVMTLAKRGRRAGPRRLRAEAATSASAAIASEIPIRVVVMAATPLRQHVGPDTLPPASAAGDGRALRRRELLLDLTTLPFSIL